LEEQARQASRLACGEDQEREQAAWMRDDAKTILADADPADVKLPCGMGGTVFLLLGVWFF